MHRAEHESSNAERLEFIYLNMVGQTLCVHTVDGAVTEGLFVSRTDDDADHAAILLSRSRNRRSERCTGLDEHQTHDLIAILLNDIVFLESNPIRVEAAAAGRVEPYRSGMLTEMNWAEIPPEDDRMAGDLETEERQWVAGKWDQFEANKKFGVVSTYSEDQYTTKLDKSKFTREQMALAERLSHEIERSQARGGIQHRIERGEEVEGDEGALYSDVGRTAKPGAPASAAGDFTKRSTPTTGKSPAYVVPRKGSATGSAAGATGGSSGGSPLTAEEPADANAALQQQQQQQSPPTPIEAASPSAASTPSTAAAPAAPGAGAKAGTQGSSSLKSLNSNAKPFVPGGGGSATGGAVVGVGIGGGGASVVPVHPHGGSVPVVIDDMMAAVSKAVEMRNASGMMLALLAPAEWLGEEETDDPSIQFYANQNPLMHHGGGAPHQHHAPQHAAAHHHLHHTHHMQHHHLHQHHHHHHHQQPQPQPHGHHQQAMHHHHLPPQSQPQQGMPQHSGGHPQQYHGGGGGGFASQGHFAASQGGAAGAQQYRQSPHSPTGGPGGNVPMQPSAGAGGFGAGGSGGAGGGGHVDPRNLPPGGAPRPGAVGKTAPQQPQQPIVAAPAQVGPTNSAASGGAGGPSAPVSVSEEPRRGMVVMRGARGAVNPTRHEESPPPQASAPPTTAQATTAGQIPGASAVVKKKGGK